MILDDYVKQKIKDKKQLSRLKCGLKEIGAAKEDLQKLDKAFTFMKKYKKAPEPQFKLKNIVNAIDRLKNKRLKIAYRLQIISGLRIGEIAKLTKKDISIDLDTSQIIIEVIKGKGNKDRRVKCFIDDWVLEELIKLTERKNGNLFYSKSYLMNKASKLNFHTHDLRKTNAFIFYYNNCENRRVTVEMLQNHLGHNLNSKTFLKYINRNINLYGTKWDKKRPF